MFWNVILILDDSFLRCVSEMWVSIFFEIRYRYCEIRFYHWKWDSVNVQRRMFFRYYFFPFRFSSFWLSMRPRASRTSAPVNEPIAKREWATIRASCLYAWNYIAPISFTNIWLLVLRLTEPSLISICHYKQISR